ncbi:TPA: hypothetical protein ACGO2X_000856 [Streptococcus suis]
MANVQTLDRRTNLRKNYFELHRIDKLSINLDDYELHHIVEFSEHPRLGRFVDEMGNVILIKKKIHIEGTVKPRNNIQRREFDYDKAKNHIMLQEEGGANPIMLSLANGDVLVDSDLLEYLKAYNRFLLSKL